MDVLSVEPASPLRLYERVADGLVRAVREGALRPGDRLPSVRRLALQEGVSISTVLQAYLHLESLGVVEVRPQSGHYVRARAAALPEEPGASRCASAPRPVAVTSLVARVYAAARDPDILPLGAASVSTDYLPVARMEREVARAAKRLGPALLRYTPPPGSLALRTQLARRSLDWGAPLSPEQLLLTNGAMEALHLCLRAVTRPGDTVALESPAYYGALQLVETLGLRALEIPTHPRDGLVVEALEDALRRERVAAVLVVPSFSNPTGACMPEAARERLAQLAARHELPVIEDDLYGDLHFGPTRPRVVKAFDPRGWVMLVGSFSKTLAPGLRVGWVAPGRFRERVELLKHTQTGGSPAVTQEAVAGFLQGGGYDRHLRTLRRQLASNVQRMGVAIGQHFPSGTRVTRPAGGALLWVELPRGSSALTLHERALGEGIGITPGPLFSPQGRFTHHLRLNAGCSWDARTEAAVATLGRLAHGLQD